MPSTELIPESDHSQKANPGAEMFAALQADLADEQPDQPNTHSLPPSPTIPGPRGAEQTETQPKELHLKDKNLEELHAALFEFGKDWSEQDRARVEQAYLLASDLHQGDEHKDKPYIFHLLRTANRVAGYLEDPDPALVIAALLHDSVEDHAKGILGRPKGDPISPKEAQVRAFGELAHRFGQRAADAVQAVTNPPGLGAGLSGVAKIEAYANKVQQAALGTDGWKVKFCDWVDNGLSLSCAELGIPVEQITKWEYKYGQAMLRLEDRYRQPDIQAALSQSAKAYVEHQFSLGHQRLIADL